MEPHRSPSGPRVLLPEEIQLIEAVGLTEAEYWEFIEKAETYTGERGEEYDLIPDIKNEPISLTTVLVNLAIGLVLTGAAYLLTPKPKAPKEKKSIGNLTVGGGSGPNKFQSTTGFDSVQDIAKMGEVIPLVFTRTGVRVNTQLVWSQIIAQKSSSQLRALFVLSKGPFELGEEGIPDIAGLAIGDTTINNYTLRKVAAYFRPNGGRISDFNHRIFGSQLEYLQTTDGHDGAFDIYWDTFSNDFPNGWQRYQPFFCSTRTPSTSQQFGAYSPIPNGTDFKLTYELNVIGDDATKDLKEEQRGRNNLVVYDRFNHHMAMDAIRNGQYPGGIYSYNGPVNPGPKGSVEGWDQIRFTIDTRTEPNNEDRYRNNKVDPVNNGTESARSEADAAIEMGDLYLLGDKTLGVCIDEIPRAPWRVNVQKKEYWFKVTEAGNVQLSQTAWDDTRPSQRDKNAYPWMQYALQRAAVAIYTNSRPCAATEFVIKSNVWRRLDGHPDVGAHPSPELIEKYEENNGSLNLGVLNKYIRRLSFFMLEARLKYSDGNWVDITGQEYFFVEGNTPVDQYHYIRINQPFGTTSEGVNYNNEYEYRFRPISGIGALRQFAGGNAATAGAFFKKLQFGSETSYGSNGYLVTYNGRRVWVNRAYLANKELYRGQDDPRFGDFTGGEVVTMTAPNGTNGVGDFYEIPPTPPTPGTPGTPETQVWQFVELRAQTRYNKMEKSIRESDGLTRYAYYWDGTPRAQGVLSSMGQKPPPGYANGGTVRFIWISPYPGNEEGVREGGYTFARRAIQQDRLVTIPGTPPTPEIPGTPGVKPVLIDAYVDDVDPVSTNGEGLKAYVEVYRNAGGGYGFLIYPDYFNPGKGYKTGDTVLVRASRAYLPNQTHLTGVTLTCTPIVFLEPDEDDRIEKGFEEIRNFSPYDAALDIVPFPNNMSASNFNGPEHTIVAVNEKVGQPRVDYPGLAMVGLHINSSTEWSNFSNFSVYVRKGMTGFNLLHQPGTTAFGAEVEAINRLPDIAYGLLTNTDWGAGEYIGPSQVDRTEFVIAANFCEKNKFFWNGVIEDRINLREWLFQQAQYCLLDATVIGGRFALTPAVPYNTDGSIGNTLPVPIAALFTDGNMRNMEVTFLAPEDRQQFRANVLWRYETPNGFPEVRQLQMELVEGSSPNDPEETFDLTQFCTNLEHATQFAQYSLMVRKYVDHTIKFETTPQAAMGLRPGFYFKVVSHTTHTSSTRFDNGSVDPRGYVTSFQNMEDGTYEVVYWSAGTLGVKYGYMVVKDNQVADNAFHNCLFSIRHTNEQSRVYKLESLDYGEDGLIEVVGSVQPLTNLGSLKILDWNPAYFRVL